jgi:hypothetical protein
MQGIVDVHPLARIGVFRKSHSRIVDRGKDRRKLWTSAAGKEILLFPIPAPGAKSQRINPNLGKIRSTQWNGHSSYNALQANLIQRLVCPATENIYRIIRYITTHRLPS